MGRGLERVGRRRRQQRRSAGDGEGRDGGAGGEYQHHPFYSHSHLLLPDDLKDVRVLAFEYAAIDACLEQKVGDRKVSGRLLTFAEELCNDLDDLARLDPPAVVC